MNKRVVIVTLILAGLIAETNNLFNPNGVPWFGSPQILETPPGYPAPGFWAGLWSAIELAWRDTVRHGALIVGLLLASLLLGFVLIRARYMRLDDYLESFFRVGLGVMFLAAAWPKLVNPTEFAMAVAQYQLLPELLVHPFAVGMPALELVVAGGLIFTRYSREYSLFIGALMIMFIVALWQALARELGIACGCFDISGAQGPADAWFALTRDVVLMVPIVWLCLRREERYLWQRSVTQFSRPARFRGR